MNQITTDPNRLATFIQLAAKENWCHRLACTTCGSQKFYDGLQNLVDEMGGGLTGSVEVAKSLAMLPLLSKQTFAEAVLIWLARDIPSGEIGRLLGRSDAGALFASMKSAQAVAQARRHDHNLRNDPAFVEVERKRKKAERSLAHQTRIAAKALRDAGRKRSEGHLE